MIDFAKPTAAALAATLGLAGVSLMATPQAAEARPSTKSYTCEGVKRFVDRRGSVVMNTTSSRVYRKFVSGRNQCLSGEYIDRYTVPTKTGSCTLFYCNPNKLLRYR